MKKLKPLTIFNFKISRGYQKLRRFEFKGKIKGKKVSIIIFQRHKPFKELPYDKTLFSVNFSHNNGGNFSHSMKLNQALKHVNQLIQEL